MGIYRVDVVFVMSRRDAYFCLARCSWSIQAQRESDHGLSMSRIFFIGGIYFLRTVVSLDLAT